MSTASASPLLDAINKVVTCYATYKAASDTVGNDTQSVQAAQTALDNAKLQLQTGQAGLDDATTAMDQAIAALQAIEPPLPPAKVAAPGS